MCAHLSCNRFDAKQGNAERVNKLVNVLGGYNVQIGLFRGLIRLRAESYQRAFASFAELGAKWQKAGIAMGDITAHQSRRSPRVKSQSVIEGQQSGDIVEEVDVLTGLTAVEIWGDAPLLHVGALV